MTANRKALVLCSGGVDSTTLLAQAVVKYGAENVYALSISYGQKHGREIGAARAVAAHYGVQQRFLDLGAIFADSACSLLAHSDAAVPAGTYAEQQAEGGEGAPVSTYVPFRNGLFLSSAASMALSLGCEVVLYGAHHDDVAGNALPWRRPSWPWPRPTLCARGSRSACPMSLPGRATKGARCPAACAPPASTAPPPSRPTAWMTRRWQPALREDSL